MPKHAATACLFVSRSPKKSTDIASDAKMTPTFVTGNTTMLGKIPASRVFAVLAPPIAAPTAAAKIYTCFPRDGAAHPRRFSAAAASAETAPASKNAVHKNAPVCIACADRCCHFCTIPSPPEAIMAVTSDNAASPVAAAVERIAAAVGFTDAAYFSRVFTRLVGESPGNYKKKSSAH